VYLITEKGSHVYKLTFGNEGKYAVSGGRMLKETSGHTRDEITGRPSKLHDRYSLSKIMTMIDLRRM